MTLSKSLPIDGFTPTFLKPFEDPKDEELFIEFGIAINERMTEDEATQWVLLIGKWYFNHNISSAAMTSFIERCRLCAGKAQP